MRRSLRLTMKNTNYKSPLKRLQTRKGKRQIDEESSRLRPAKRQKLNGLTKRQRLNLAQRRSSIIIINDENDIGSTSFAKKAGIQDEPDDSIIILDDWNEKSEKNATKSETKLNPTEDVTVVWSSVPVTIPKAGDDFIPLEVEAAAPTTTKTNFTNLEMLKGDYPQKWLGEWLEERKMARKQNQMEIAKRIRDNLQQAESAKARKIEQIRKLVETRVKEKIMEKGQIRENRSEVMEITEIAKISDKSKFKDKGKMAVDEVDKATTATATTTATTTKNCEINDVGKKKNKKKAKNDKFGKMREIEETMEKARINEKCEAGKEIIDITEKSSTSGELREIVIDGPNVARAYTRGKYFSQTGLKIVIDFFKNRGHKVVAFIPQHVRSRNREMLEDLNRDGYVVFTPSRKAGSKIITPYDDRYVLEYATKCNGIIISNDQYKDLYQEKPEWRDTIENCILPPTFVGDHLMFPDDPLGRNGPKLDAFLRHST
ncbi:uncharacterized protein LOC122512652 [Leptopilina heterotoma]|uniref:uncharacterized protein LOC122512652 n=1 Tax=Leptopilina heterotoma TaxID=63436 RepID=UPI001CAA020D|nr:uncharacterized protein LOC122512652 [Leptopilina heterotoma]